MQYEELIEDIFRRHPSVQNTGFNNGSYKAGIESMKEFSRILADPWKSYDCIHIAGTNGKGSVSSMLAAGISAGQNTAVGLYTSPHLLDFRERIKLIRDGHFEMPSKDEVMQFLERYAKEIEGLSFFEITTGLAFWWFQKKKVSVAVIETGLGGRLDSTNIITPVLSVITSIGLDHCAMLGDTTARIAYEKAGIIKPGVPALIWDRENDTAGVFKKKSAEVGAPLYFAEETIQQIPDWKLDLKGEYQSVNLRTVLAALQILAIKPEQEAIEHTAGITGLHGRWEILGKNPLIISDIGHNPAALKWNFTQLEEYGKPLKIIYGIMADKALEDIAPLMPSNAIYYLCAPKGSRPLPADTLRRKLADMRPDLETFTFGSVTEAVTCAISQSHPNDIIYIGGSNFVVAEAMPLFID